MSPSADSCSSPFAAVANGVRVRIRLTPRASRAAVEGLIADAAGRAALKVAVAAPPVEGEANAALIRLLSREWEVGKGSLSIVAGATGRSKTVLVAGDGPSLLARLDRWRRRRGLSPAA